MSDKTGGKAVFGEVADENPAANVVRAKLDAIYADEPDAAAEEKEIKISGAHSKHQKFIADLMASGKSVVEVQLAWHEYYESLQADEKRAVWDEFYKGQHHAAEPRPKPNPEQPRPLRAKKHRTMPSRPQNVKELKAKVISKVNADGKLQAKHHIKGAVFAVSVASLVTGLLFLITNNELFLAQIIRPSSSVAASPIITDGSAVGKEPKIIIPKINLEAPIVDSIGENTEDAIQAGLENGVALYPFTGKPGEKANPIFFGHSSNNLFNKGKYKFVFVRLHQLQVGDTYAINYNGVQYVYKIFSREVVTPDRVDVLYAQPKPVMSTLITCDPPGTSDLRLVLQAEQISPSPDKNKESTAKPTEQLNQIPSNAPSLWRRLLGID